MRIPQRVPLQSPIRQLRVEHTPRWEIEWGEEVPIDAGYWCIWLTANKDFTLGTFIKLCHDGKVLRITLHEDGTETVFEVRND